MLAQPRSAVHIALELIFGERYSFFTETKQDPEVALISRAW